MHQHTQHNRLATDARRRLSRNGFTLLELMLVLAVITMLGALAAPSLGRLLERQKLVGATDEIRLQLDRARLKAMRTGQTQVFECELGTRNFTVKPLVSMSDANSAGAGATVLAGGSLVETQQNNIVTAAGPELGDTKQIDESVTFLNCMVAGDIRAFSVAEQVQMSGSNVNELSTQNVGQKVLFYPDGSTSTAEIQIRTQRGEVRAVQIRGLTGHTKTLQLASVPEESSSPASSGAGN